MTALAAQRLLNFFNHEALKHFSFSELRAEAGTYDPREFEELSQQELVEYDTRTGIAFQMPEEWAVVPTSKAADLLKEIK